MSDVIGRSRSRFGYHAPMTETPQHPDPDPEDEAPDHALDDDLDVLLDEELERDEGGRLPPHGDPYDDDE